MNKHIRSAALLLIAGLTPGLASAGIIFSDVTLTAKTDAGGPVTTDLETIPNLGPGGVEALTRAAGEPFPNVPNSVGSAFASAAQLALGPGGILPGVGVNGFFLRNALPPHELSAQASITQTITNDSATETESLLGNFFIPQPITRFFGVGDSLPSGGVARDAFGFVSALLATKLTRPDGSIVETTLLNYGIVANRDGTTGEFVAQSLDGVDLPRGEGPDGSLIFLLPDLNLENFDLAQLGPGDILEVTYLFTATAQTGFGETGVFAAIGDPFNLSSGGGRFELAVGQVPEPATWTLLASGLLIFWCGTRLSRARMKPCAPLRTRRLGLPALRPAALGTRR